MSAARPRRHSPPSRALRRRPAPAPARPPRAPGRRLREAARPRALRAGTGGPGGRSRPLSATWQRPAGPRCCGSTGPCCGRASASADTTTGARPCDPGGGKSAGWGGRGGGGRGSPALRARPELGGLGGGEGGLPRARWRWLAAGAAAPQGPALGRLQPCPGWARCLSPLPHAVPEVELKVWSTL